MRHFSLHYLLIFWLSAFTAGYTALSESSSVSEAQRSATSPAAYSFNAYSSHNLAVYFGRTNATPNTTLLAQCSDANIDIVIIAFITAIISDGGYPRLAFTNLCGNRTAIMEQRGASGLRSCPDLASQLIGCQQLGKKVLIGSECTIGHCQRHGNPAVLQIADRCSWWTEWKCDILECDGGHTGGANDVERLWWRNRLAERATAIWLSGSRWL